MDSKPWYASKTVWINILMGIAALGTIVNLLPSSWTPDILIVSAVANIILRIMTNQTIQSE